MIYKQQIPSGILSNFINCFWMVDSQSDATIKTEKIIPDGYPEMIFHYRKPYRANITGSWYQQDKDLMAGQIKNHFYLSNTGESGMIGIKFQPWALKVLFDTDMSKLTDKVLTIDQELLAQIKPVKQTACGQNAFEDKVSKIEDWFSAFLSNKNFHISKGQKATQLIIERKGGITIKEVLDQVGISERSLERYFKDHIGLTPKFYSRVIRFSNIFHLMHDKSFKWTDITYLAGFYDQSHFIKNFKEFTGEEPSNYGFSEKNMANFFLKK